MSSPRHQYAIVFSVRSTLFARTEFKFLPKPFILTKTHQQKQKVVEATLVSGEGICWGAGVTQDNLHLDGHNWIVVVSSGSTEQDTTCGISEAGQAECWYVGMAGNWSDPGLWQAELCSFEECGLYHESSNTTSMTLSTHPSKVHTTFDTLQVHRTFALPV